MPPRTRSRTPSKARTPSANKRAATPAKGKKAATPAPAAAARSPSPRKSGSPATSSSKAPPSLAANPPFKFTPEKDLFDGDYEFGGWKGALTIMIFSHFIIYYFWLCVEFYNGELVHPWHSLLRTKEGTVSAFAAELWGLVVRHASPTLYTFGLYSAFMFLQYFLALTVPGPRTFGLPAPSENMHKRTHRCNAVWCWYFLIGAIAALHYFNVLPMWTIRENFGSFMTAAVIWGDGVSIIVYLYGQLCNRSIRMSGNVIYDFFMGAVLHPRLPGDICLKMYAEIRNSWMLLFLLATSCAAKMYKETGSISLNMYFLLLAHLLYVNACQKGEECIPPTWDISHEKFGWMLCFWNFAGVPFLYCMQAMYIQTKLRDYSYPWPVIAVMTVVLLAAYYVFDTANSQKNRYRMKKMGVPEDIIRRNAFPQFSWGYIENPRTIKSERGELFVDGWWGKARKMNYTADTVMALLYGLACGFENFIPYFYFFFFLGMLSHRSARDDAQCRKKYGPLWQEYLRLVPHKFIPGLF